MELALSILVWRIKKLMENMRGKRIHIIIAYIFHLVLIVMSFFMMESYYDSMQISFICFGILYIVYWIICSRKRYLPWTVYLNFCVGVLAQVLLNYCGIIPKDEGWFSGLGKFFYMIFVVAHAVIVGIINLILYVITKRKWFRYWKKR